MTHFQLPKQRGSQSEQFRLLFIFCVSFAGTYWPPATARNSTAVHGPKHKTAESTRRQARYSTGLSVAQCFVDPILAAARNLGSHNGCLCLLTPIVCRTDKTRREASPLWARHRTTRSQQIYDKFVLTSAERTTSVLVQCLWVSVAFVLLAIIVGF